MKTLALSPIPKISRLDIAFYLLAIAFGGAIVFVNNITPAETPSIGDLHQYMEKILNRMDVVGTQLEDWYAQDVSQ